MKHLWHILATIFLSLYFFVGAAPPKTVIEEFMVPAVESSIKLYGRNKYPEERKTIPGEKILLFVHGATYPSETTFDLVLNGPSLGVTAAAAIRTAYAHS